MRDLSLVEKRDLNLLILALSARCHRELRRLGAPPAGGNGGWSVAYAAEGLAIRRRYDLLIDRALARAGRSP